MPQPAPWPRPRRRRVGGYGKPPGLVLSLVHNISCFLPYTEASER
jgi:hypothetical protein